MHTVNEINPTLHVAPSDVAGHMMRAIVHRQYGTLNVPTLGEVERPVPVITTCSYASMRRAQASVTTTSSPANRY